MRNFICNSTGWPNGTPKLARWPLTFVCEQVWGHQKVDRLGPQWAVAPRGDLQTRYSFSQISNQMNLWRITRKIKNLWRIKINLFSQNVKLQNKTEHTKYDERTKTNKNLYGLWKPEVQFRFHSAFRNHYSELNQSIKFHILNVESNIVLTCASGSSQR